MIKTGKYVVGYVDLLGAKSKTIQDDDSNKNLNSLSGIYRMAKNTQDFIKDELKNTQLHIKIFSDNVAVVQRMDSKDYDAGAAVIGFLLHFQLFAFMKERWLMRGCITCGDLYVDEDFMWGRALIEAYQGESEIAIYPRIIMTRKLLRQLRFERFTEAEQNIGRDFDGEYYLRYYDILNRYKPASKKKRLTGMRASLISMLEESEERPKLRQKTVWLVNQHNIYCRKSDATDLQIELAAPM